ncbi:recombinase RecT [Clostridioides difficile]|uniref:recombinase RecT n=1 Tax=Clostridioides difficile TaxID=1496 RepID=UPI00038D80DA|nr:recombinase RecT [Clostridioides difficile]EQK11270.1 recombinase, phage RecT family protein [Clostridioides difficile P59]MBH6897305.1 recombinase RecT [Clostridioides difficile]MBY2487114.1 recombinase RecT [Clostridioides difficile]MCM0737884.1 recombinase RecT [Clostridioides difficile]MCO5809963.1 recombinase RecT [Clostridioides difficile]
MANEIQRQVSVKNLLSTEAYKKRFKEVLKDKANTFMASVVNVSNLPSLKDAEPNSILKSAMVAATLDLPIDPNLGFSYLVPFTNKGVKEAQFQIGYKGFIQLAMRTGQYKTINAIEIYEGEIKSVNRLTGEIEFNKNEDEIDKEIVVGYIAYFKLLNGFEKTLYMSKEDMEKYAKRYSQTYKSNKDYVVKSSLWTTDFDAMAVKTVLKRLLSKYGILSIEMQKALETDQAVIKDDNSVEYVDRQVEEEIEENANKKTIDMTTEEKEKAIEIKESKPEEVKQQEFEAPPF